MPTKESFAYLPVNHERVAWEETPYNGVFIRKVDEKKDVQNPKIPKYTAFELRMEPDAGIPLHLHKREANWEETMNFTSEGKFEIQRFDKKINELKKIKKKVSPNRPLTIKIHAYEVFGITNIGSATAYFRSIMVPGFTGYEEIEVKRI